MAQSTFASQEWQNTVSDHFCTLRCRKSARRCCAKHILSQHVKNKHTFGPLLEVERSQKCTPWREARFEVNMSTQSGNFSTIRLPFHVQEVHAVVARSTFGSQTCQKQWVLRFFKPLLICLMSFRWQIDGYRHRQLDGWLAVKLVQFVKFVKLVL